MEESDKCYIKKYQTNYIDFNFKKSEKLQKKNR